MFIKKIKILMMLFIIDMFNWANFGYLFLNID